MNFKYKRLIPVLTIALFISSCKKELLDINKDPNNPTVSAATPELVLPNALNVTASIMNNPTGGNALFAFAGIWMGHMSYSGNYAISTENVSYAITNNFASGAFGFLYDNITDYDFVEKKGIEQKNKFYEGVGKLMKAYDFQTLVDLYGNVPYNDALKGTLNSRPKYDNQKDIYDSISKKIDTARILFQNAIDNNASIYGDIMFKGDASLWLKFANTVKLRLLLRQSERSDRSSSIQAELAKFDSNTEFLDVDAAVNPGYINSSGKTNPFWGSNYNTSGTYTQDFYRAGQYAVSFFTTNNDPRLSGYYKPAEGTGKYQGNYFGDQGLPNSKTSGFGPGVLKSYDQSSIIMSLSESYFIQAEAALRGWINGDTKTLYQYGITASFEYLGLSDNEAQTYYTQTNNKQTNWDAVTTFDEKLALIIRQKWAALTLINELEAWNDYRRLHLPADIPLSLSPYSTGKIPSRLLYPQREYDVNAANVNAQGSITPDTKIWWQP